MILNKIKSIYLYKFICKHRYFSFKTIKRPDIKQLTAKTLKLEFEKNLDQNSLAKQIEAKIKSTGPITVAEYMKEVLTNPVKGYYMSKDVFGVEGDFITSPEISQIFGELVAVWCITEWRKIGSPRPLQIIELGPGRGTLTRDILKVFSQFNLQEATSFHLVEISPFLSKIQAQNICYKYNDFEDDEKINKNTGGFYMKGETVSGMNVYWYRYLEDVPKQFSIILANEFFDALPIHKFQKENDVWKEVLIDVHSPFEQNKFRFVLSKSQTPHSKLFHNIENDKRECLEYSFELVKHIDLITQRLEEYGGISLIMDYGHFGEKTDTFRAFKNHKLHDPLFEPGTADLTADVDFSYVKFNAEKEGKTITFGPIEQGKFLQKMEGQARLEILLENCPPQQKNQIQSAYDMLTNGNQMGKRFKFFAIFPAVLNDYLNKVKVSGFY